MTTTNPTRTMTLGDFALTGGLGRYRAYLLVAAGALFVAVAAQVSFTPPQWYADIFGAIGLPIEGSPVPITLQTLAVGLTGAALGSRLGGMSLLLYMFAGIAGLPVYAGAVADVLCRRGRLWCDVNGSIWGRRDPVLVDAVLRLHHRLYHRWIPDWPTSRKGLGSKHLPLTALALFVGSIAIYAFGLPWLHFSFGDMTLSRTLEWGLWPFIPGDTLKLLVAAGALPGAWALIGRSRKPEEPEVQF